MDLEVEARDELNKDHDMAWNIRCLLRRLRVSRLLVSKCPKLEYIEWVQSPKDSEGNDMEHIFLVQEEELATGEIGRSVKIKRDWWMKHDRSPASVKFLGMGMILAVT